MGNATCPRCGRRHEGPELVLCGERRGARLQGSGAQGGEGTTITVRVGPILSEAVASVGPEIARRRSGGSVVKGGFPTTVSEMVSETG